MRFLPGFPNVRLKSLVLFLSGLVFPLSAMSTNYSRIQLKQLLPFGGDAYVVLVKKEGRLYTLPWRHALQNDVYSLKAVLLKTKGEIGAKNFTLEVVDVADAMEWLPTGSSVGLPSFFVLREEMKLRDFFAYAKMLDRLHPCAEGGFFHQAKGYAVRWCNENIQSFHGSSGDFGSLDMARIFASINLKWPSPDGRNTIKKWGSMNIWGGGDPDTLFISKSFSAEGKDFDTWPDMQRGDVLRIANAGQDVRRLKFDVPIGSEIFAFGESGGVWAVIGLRDEQRSTVVRADSTESYVADTQFLVEEAFLPERDGFISFDVPQPTARQAHVLMRFDNFKTNEKILYEFNVEPSFNYVRGQILTGEKK